MRRLVVNTFLTLDGVMQAPGGPEEDPTGGFAYGGWSVEYWDETMSEIITKAMEAPFDLVLGRKTYEIFAAHWPYTGDHRVPSGDQSALDDTALGLAGRMNAATKYVASRTLDRVTWQNSRLIAGDVAIEVARLKNEDGPELQVHGSSDLLQTLITAGLIDEFRLWIFPVVTGRGKRLFGSGTVPSSLTLVDHRTSTTGVSIGVYRPAGAIRTGSFALPEPTEAELERRRRMAAEDRAAEG
ncbi:MAG TPA: dihydrofolate reductase family protein [Bauldia sp.]|nr:dihydrofolate reductase family protein [Bauldia sp.]